MFACGLVIGSSFLGGLPRFTKGAMNEAPAVEQVQTDRCVGSDQVSAFVCRNTWMPSSRYGNR
jgi:hypothetical protein